MITHMSPLARASLFRYPMPTNRFAVMNIEDIGKEVTKYISIKDRLNLTMVAKQVDLGGVDVDHDQHAMNAKDDHRLLRCMIL